MLAHIVQASDIETLGRLKKTKTGKLGENEILTGGSLRLSCILHNLFRDAHLDHVWRAYCAYCAPNTLNRSKTIISKDKGKGQFQNRVHGVLLQQLLEHSWRLGLPGPCFILANPDQVLSLSITNRIPIHRLFSDLVNFGFFHRLANF